MSQIKKYSLVGLILSLLLWGTLLPTKAQDQPRPTPTPDNSNQLPTPTPDTPAPTSTPSAARPSAAGSRGTIQGMIYQDVNRDGKCVNSGVEGEGPVEGIDITFVSSDEQTIITLQSGPDGRYSLTAAGYSYWGVTVNPDANWAVTSEETLFVPIYEDSLVATDINFCLRSTQSTGTAGATAVLLPEAGGSTPTSWLNWALSAGLLLMLVGIGIYWRREQGIEA